MKQLHPGAKWLFRIRGFFSTIFIIFFLGFYSSFYILKEINGLLVTIVTISVFIITLIFAEVFARLSYHFWKYELGQDSLKLERGIIWKKYSNVPYQRVQNVDIHRGIIARMLGFSTLDIQTAGLHMSGKYGAKSEGHIPAVSINEAEKMRDFLMKKIGKKQGL